MTEDRCLKGGGIFTAMERFLPGTHSMFLKVG